MKKFQQVTDRNKVIRVAHAHKRSNGDIFLSGAAESASGEMTWGEEYWSDEFKATLQNARKSYYTIQKRKYCGEWDEKGNLVKRAQLISFPCRYVKRPGDDKRTYLESVTLNLMDDNDYILYCYLINHPNVRVQGYEENVKGEILLTCIDVVTTDQKRVSKAERIAECVVYVKKLKAAELYDIAMLLGIYAIDVHYETLKANVIDYITLNEKNLAEFEKDVMGKDVSVRIKVKKAIAYGIISVNNGQFYITEKNIPLGLKEDAVERFMLSTDIDKLAFVNFISEQVEHFDIKYGRTTAPMPDLTIKHVFQEDKEEEKETPSNRGKGRWPKKEEKDLI